MTKQYDIHKILPIFPAIILWIAVAFISYSMSDIPIGEPPSIVPRVTVAEEKTLDDIIRKGCAERNLDEEQCYRDVKALAKMESGERTEAVGDNGTSYGIFQIHLPAHPTITKEQATDPEFSTYWTIDNLVRNGYPEYRKLALQCHNGCSKNNGYAGKVMGIASGL